MKIRVLSIVITLLLASGLTSCSIKKKGATTDQTQAAIEGDESIAGLANEDELDGLADDDTTALIEQEPSQDVTEEAGSDIVAIKDANLENNAPVIDTSVQKVAAVKVKNLAGGISEYTVRKGDTLMLISYKVYGDYSKWRQLSQMNPGISTNSLSEGVKVQFKTSDKNYPTKSPGMAYLIQDGDTLGTISSDKYGTVKKWRNIYENNRQLIRDPNLIFSGFTLYLPKLSDEVATNYIELQ